MAWNIQTESIEISAGTALGARIGNPQKAMIFVQTGKKGMTACRNFDLAAPELRGVAAARSVTFGSFAELI